MPTAGEQEPVDPDVTRGDRDTLRVLAAIGAGGAIGAAVRWAVAQQWPTRPGQIPWATLGVNVAGCFLIGVLMVLVAHRWSRHRYVRPFLGVGVLGGLTTFSTFALEGRDLLAAGDLTTAMTYAAASLALGLLAVLVGLRLTRAALGVGVGLDGGGAVDGPAGGGAR